MAYITKRIDYDNDLTIIVVEGSLEFHDVFLNISEFYINNLTKNTLVDLRKGSIGDISSEDLKQIAYAMKEYIKNHQGGKTAIVTQIDVDFGMLRMYEAYAQFENLPISYKIFRDIEEAREWLQEEI
jgi:hypothetical protein